MSAVASCGAGRFGRADPKRTPPFPATVSARGPYCLGRGLSHAARADFDGRVRSKGRKAVPEAASPYKRKSGVMAMWLLMKAALMNPQTRKPADDAQTGRPNATAGAVTAVKSAQRVFGFWNSSPLSGSAPQRHCGRAAVEVPLVQHRGTAEVHDRNWIPDVRPAEPHLFPHLAPVLARGAGASGRDFPDHHREPQVMRGGRRRRQPVRRASWTLR